MLAVCYVLYVDGLLLAFSFVMCCVLCAGCCMLLVVWCELRIVSWLLCVVWLAVWCLPCDVGYVWNDVHRLMCAVV